MISTVSPALYGPPVADTESTFGASGFGTLFVTVWAVNVASVFPAISVMPEPVYATVGASTNTIGVSTVMVMVLPDNTTSPNTVLLGRTVKCDAIADAHNGF